MRVLRGVKVFLVLVLLVLGWGLLLVFIFYVGGFVLRVKEGSEGKVCSFERGFSSIGEIQNSFRIHFFVVMMLFVVFDLEVVLFLGVLVSDFSSVGVFLVVLGFLVGGLYMEWVFGKLVWFVCGYVYFFDCNPNMCFFIWFDLFWFGGVRCLFCKVGVY